MIAGPTRQVKKKRPAKSAEQSAKPALSPADASDESYDNTVEAVRDGGKRLERNVWPRPPPPPMPPSPTTPRTTLAQRQPGVRRGDKRRSTGKAAQNSKGIEG